MTSIPRVKKITKETFFYSSTRTIRALLGTASLFVGLIFLVNAMWIGQVTDRPAFVYYKAWGNDYFWAAMFIIHFVGVVWRIYRIRPCIWCGIGVNFYGLVLWLYATVAINFGVGLLLPTAGMEWVVSGAAAWCLYRTGWDQEEFIITSIESLK